jgi:hypothetical protein
VEELDTMRCLPFAAFWLLMVAAGPAAPSDPAVEDAQGYARAVWIVTAADVRGGPVTAPPRPVVTVLNLPAGWMPGDAAVLLMAPPAGLDKQRHLLRHALLDDGAAVLEISAAPGRSPEHLLADLLGGLVAVTREDGAGVVVALGLGSGGEAVLLATQEETAARFLGTAGPRFAAAASLGAAAPVFTAGRPPGAAQRWAERVPPLCRILADALAATAQGAAIQDCMQVLGAARPCDGAMVPSTNAR